MLMNLEQFREFDQRKRQMLIALAEGKDLAESGFREEAVVVMGQIIDTLAMRNDNGLAQFALPVARRCLGCGHKPTDLRGYANAVIAFCERYRADWGRCEFEEPWRNSADPEAEFMAGVAKAFHEQWQVVN